MCVCSRTVAQVRLHAVGMMTVAVQSLSVLSYFLRQSTGTAGDQLLCELFLYREQPELMWFEPCELCVRLSAVLWVSANDVLSFQLAYGNRKKDRNFLMEITSP